MQPVEGSQAEKRYMERKYDVQAKVALSADNFVGSSCIYEVSND